MAFTIEIEVGADINEHQLSMAEWNKVAAYLYVVTEQAFKNYTRFNIDDQIVDVSYNNDLDFQGMVDDQEDE